MRYFIFALGLLFSIDGAAQSPLHAPGASGGQSPVDVIRVEPHSHTKCALAALGTNDTDPWGSCLIIGYKNVSVQPITRIRFKVTFITPFKESSPPFFCEDAQKVKPGKAWTVIWHDGVYWQQYGGDQMGANVSVDKVIFADGTIWTADATQPAAISRPYALPAGQKDEAKPTAPAADSSCPPGMIQTASSYYCVADPNAASKESDLRKNLIDEINSSFIRDKTAGYAEISGNKLTVHSERASAMRFHAILASQKVISEMQKAGLESYFYTNDVDQKFLYDLKSEKIVPINEPAPQSVTDPR